MAREGTTQNGFTRIGETPSLVSYFPFVISTVATIPAYTPLFNWTQVGENCERLRTVTLDWNLNGGGNMGTEDAEFGGNSCPNELYIKLCLATGIGGWSIDHPVTPGFMEFAFNPAAVTWNGGVEFYQATLLRISDNAHPTEYVTTETFDTSHPSAFTFNFFGQNVNMYDINQTTFTGSATLTRKRWWARDNGRDGSCWDVNTGGQLEYPIPLGR